MLVDSAAVALPAGPSLVNAFSGRPIEFIGTPSVARLLCATDVEFVSVQWLINVGGVQSVPIAAGSTVNVASTGGAGPKEDEDQMATNVPLPAGSRNQLNVTNPGANAASTFRYRATILP